ncbi:ABC transporter substrate-binding protein [Demequina sp. NBRC 110051]|uniref:ABC transporter substrate-binding protein n=1 Tax=Demequina sp. NBRC 110051 TaxID=1570340 RepID=UPI000A046341|nr:ABC transporter substrate-binding protein [Demequina sp. NBRC 110051]
MFPTLKSREASASTTTRPFLRPAFAATVGVAALALAACGSQADPEASADVSAAGGEMTQGGELVFAEQQAPPSLDPGTLDRAYTDFTMLAYDPLFYLTPQGEVEPRLAESWEFVGGENKELDVTLREGMTFSDGDPVTADAVVASLEYSRDAQGNHAHFLEDATFEATGDLTFAITVETPNPMLPKLLTQQYPIGQIISPQGLADPAALDLASDTHGAGPYVYVPEESVPGDHYVYEANPDYYDPEQQHWDSVEIRIFADKQAALNAATTDQIMMFKGDGSLAAQAQSSGLSVIANPGIMTGLFLIDRDGETVPALGDVRVRQAINYAIDRETVTTALLGEYGIPTFQTAIEGADGYSEANADLYAYDPDKARELLAEAGYADGFELPVMTAVFAGFEQMGEAIKGQLAEVGITVTTDVKTDIAAYSEGATDKSFGAFVGGYDANPIYQQGLDLFLPSSNFFNGFGTESEELNDLWLQAASADPATQADLDVQIEDYLLENAWFAPVAWAPVMYFATDSIGGVETSAGSPFASPLAWYPAS